MARATARKIEVGALCVVPRAPARGVGRVERLLPVGGPPERARLFFYDDGSFGVFPLDAVAPAPPGVWDKGQGG